MDSVERLEHMADEAETRNHILAKCGGGDDDSQLFFREVAAELRRMRVDLLDALTYKRSMKQQYVDDVRQHTQTFSEHVASTGLIQEEAEISRIDDQIEALKAVMDAKS